jgi:hypothetical protein
VQHWREQRLLGAVAAVAAAAVWVALLFPWFHITRSAITRAGGGFELAFQPGTENAWSTVAVAAAVLSACALVSAGRMRAALGGSRLAVAIAAIASLLAIALIAFVLLNPPTVAESIGTAGLFTRQVGSRGAHRGVPVGLAWGGFAALGFAVTSGTAVLASVVLAHRRPSV